MSDFSTNSIDYCEQICYNFIGRGETMEKKKQHYVPKFHLRQWSKDGKRISLYNKYSTVFVDNNGAIKTLASRDYFYDKNGELENLLGKIESKVSPLYQKIITTESLSEITADERELLYLHFILSEGRTEATGKDYEALEKEKLKLNHKL